MRMRNPRTGVDLALPPITPAGLVHARRRAALRLATALIAPAAMLGAMVLPAQAQFTAIYGFGDSYADTGVGPGGALRLAGVTACINNPALCRFTGSTNFVESLQSFYRLPGLTNYAIGGALTNNTNTLDAEIAAQDPLAVPGTAPGFPYELARLAYDGVRFSERDLIALTIGGNDSSLLTNDVAAATALGMAAAGRAVNGTGVGPLSGTYDGVTYTNVATYGVQQLVAAGARNIAWMSAGNSKYFPDPEGGAGIGDAARDALAHTYYDQIQILLQPMAQAGVRIFLFNFEILQARIFANPGQYGFAANALCQQSVTPQTPTCFYDNAVHPTGTAMALVARFMANQIDAPTTVVPQGGIATGLATAFAGSTLGRLDAERTFMPYSFGPAMAYAMATKAPAGMEFPAAADKRWSLFSNVTYDGGSRDGQFAASSYDYSSVGGSLGIDYRIDRNWRVGGVFGYSQPDIKLAVQDAHNRIDAYQFAAYGAYTSTNWFGDALAAYGRQQFALDRLGVTDTLTANTHADVFTIAARGGYLADMGAVRAGPIAGLTYTRATIDRYNESGDELLAMIVERQTVDALTGSAGLQLRYPFQYGNGLYNPFVNITAEHDFTGSGRVVTTTLVSAPLLPVLTSVPDAGSRTYGKFAAGIAAAVAGNVSATVTASTTFARDGGNDFSVSTGVKMAF